MPPLGQRVTELEEQMQDQAKDFRAETKELRADMTRRFDEVRAEMDRRFDRVDQRFDRMDQKIDRHFVWVVGMFIGAFVTLVLGLVGLSLQISRLPSI